MAGMAVSAYARPGQMPRDPHTGLPQVPLTQQMVDQRNREASRDNALTRGRSDFYSLANNNRNISAQYTDPRTGLSLQYGPGSARGSASGSGGGAGDLEDFDFSRALATVQPALPPVPGPAQMPAHVTGPSPADSAAAQAAEFGRAKDRIGKLGRGSMTALNESFSSRGFGGSNMEAGATQNLLSDLQGQEGEVIRDQAIQNLVRQRQVEDRNYAGDVNQRGQDIGFTTTTRGQDIGAATSRAQMQIPLMQLIAANRRRRVGAPLY